MSSDCLRCGEAKKLLFTDWYCDCDEKASDLFGYGMVSTNVYDSLDDLNTLPKSFCIYLFEDKTVAVDFAASYIGFTVICVDLTFEDHVMWSSADQLWVHKASRNLPCKVVH